MPAWLLLPAASLCIALFTLDFNGSHSNSAGDSGLIYSNRRYNCMLMSSNESHLIDTRDNDDTCGVNCCWLDYSSWVSQCLKMIWNDFLAVPRFLWGLLHVFSTSNVYSTLDIKGDAIFFFFFLLGYYSNSFTWFNSQTHSFCQNVQCCSTLVPLCQKCCFSYCLFYKDSKNSKK